MLLKQALFALALLAVAPQAQALETSHATPTLEEQLDQNALRPGRPGRPLPPPRPFYKECFADNARGILFRATGYADDYWIQDDAMRLCAYNSFFPQSCRPLGCRFF